MPGVEDNSKGKKEMARAEVVEGESKKSSSIQGGRRRRRERGFANNLNRNFKMGYAEDPDDILDAI